MKSGGAGLGKPTAIEVEDPGKQVDAALLFLQEAGDVSFTGEEEKALVRKIDLMVLPLLSIVYFLQFVDKNLINFANIMGLSADTGTSPAQFASLAWAFYLAYLLSEPVAGYLLQKLPVAKVLGCNVILWGICVTLNCVCKNYASLITLRVLLGVFESCVSPSMMLITSMWYKRREQPLRFGLWAGSVGLGIIVGALCSYGLQHYQGTTFKSWQIMFLCFGLITIFFGILVVLYLPDNPMSCHLTQRERVVAVIRLKEDTTGIENKVFKPAQLWELLRDPHAWLMCAMTVAINIPNAAVSTFQAGIIQGLGYTAKQAALLNIPSGVVAIVAITSASYTAFRFRNRSLIILSLLIPGIIGAALMTFLPNGSGVGRLMGVYLINTIPSTTPIIYSWVAANFAGHTKKTMINAIIMMAFCLGNILGPLTFTTPPEYWGAKVTIIVVLGFAIIVLSILVYLYRRSNSRRAHRLSVQGHGTADGDNAFLDLTDRKNKAFMVSFQLCLILERGNGDVKYTLQYIL
ncbi:MFS general substrate transporter [Thozetella sp. PMI_491]|nr:MFS general substrate transporter [Thozetella sp. PMI_491]